MSDNMAYLPRVLLETLPELRAGLNGTARGEVLLYPFLQGCLILCAANNFPANGEYRITVDQSSTLNVYVGNGFCFSLNYLPFQTPQLLYGKTVSIAGNDGLTVASGTFYMN